MTILTFSKKGEKEGECVFASSYPFFDILYCYARCRDVVMSYSFTDEYNPELQSDDSILYQH